MYSGFIDSDASAEHHIFYWMFKTEDYDNAPIAIWMNGGPGASSEFGNFLENGPLQIFESIDSSSGSDVYTFTVKDNPLGSWADVATMIYVDQPIGTGFSYSDPETFLTSMDEAAEEFLTFMKNLYVKYPEFVGKPLYMTGESYGGKYLPAYSKKLLEEN